VSPSLKYLTIMSQGSQRQPAKESKQNLSQLFKLGDHITSDGFKNDGYDYSKHYKEMGNTHQAFMKHVDLPY
jgi:hypothetical protein